MKKAEELCSSFSSKNLNPKQMIIKRFMKSAKLKMPPPKRKASKNKESKKLHQCLSIECTSNPTCRRRLNCPIQRILNHSNKTVSILQSKNKGKSLIIQENCKKNKFVIEYRGKSHNTDDGSSDSSTSAHDGLPPPQESSLWRPFYCVLSDVWLMVWPSTCIWLEFYFCA
jgi:hypothetical protein